MAFAKFIAALLTDAHTIVELVEETGLHPTTLRNWVRALRDERVVHIESYRVEVGRRRYASPAFRLGNGKADAKRVSVGVKDRDRMAATRAAQRARELAVALRGGPTQPTAS